MVAENLDGELAGQAVVPPQVRPIRERLVIDLEDHVDTASTLQDALHQATRHVGHRREELAAAGAGFRRRHLAVRLRDQQGRYWLARPEPQGSRDNIRPYLIELPADVTTRRGIALMPGGSLQLQRKRSRWRDVGSPAGGGRGPAAGAPRQAARPSTAAGRLLAGRPADARSPERSSAKPPAPHRSTAGWSAACC